MVLRILLIFFVLGSANSFARRGNPYFSKAQKSFKKKQYTKSLRSLKKGYNFKKTKRIPAAALFLIAMNYQKLKKYPEAIYFFNRVVKNNYRKKHIRVIRALKKDELDEVKISKTLGSAYFYLAQSHYGKFIKTEKYQDAIKAKKYFTICDDTDFNDKCADFLENINEKIEYSKKKKDNFEFFVYGGRLIFQDRITIEHTETGTTGDIISNNTALCYGAGLRLGNAFSGYEIGGCAFSGTTTVVGIASDGTTNNDYKQSGIPIGGILVEAGYYIRPDNEATRLGVSLPVIYRSGIFSEPSGYTITNAKSFNFGIMFTAGLDVSYFELQTKLGHMGDTNILMLNGVYTF
jgi:tetratricopeptide (TPR) repeat protein